MFPVMLSVLKVLSKFEDAAEHYRVFRSRYLFFNALYKRVVRKIRASDDLISSAAKTAAQCGSEYDLHWCMKHKVFWHEASEGSLSSVSFTDDRGHYMFIFQH